MYTLKEKTKEMATFTIGMEVEKFVNLDYDDEIELLVVVVKMSVLF